MFTYKATNTLNGKFYIGSSMNFEHRKKAHLNSKEKYPFQSALRKNPEAFEWEVWKDDSENRELEQALLDMWFGKEQCYNLCPIANHVMTGRKHTEETKQKIRKKKVGSRHNEESKKKMSAAALIHRVGAIITEATKQKLRELNTGERHPRYGMPVSLETRERLSKSNTGKNAGKKWWINKEGETKFQKEQPGEGWRRGRK